ncbi:MAG: hypothetical protein NT018_06850 [Armatimonadetes bacterium]|nr:hypothetical protein [Armatimonadota bacterium]
MMRFTKFVWVIAIAAWAAPLMAAEEALPVVKPSIKTIAAFKNGLGFVFKSGKAELKNGWTALEELPSAGLGMLWIGTTSAAGRVEEVVSYKGKIEKEADSLSIPQILAANVGQKVTLTYSNAAYVAAATAANEITGTILSVPDDRQPEAAALSSSNYRPYDDSRGTVVMIKLDSGEIAVLNKADVRSIRLPAGAALKTKLSRDVSSAKIRISGNEPSAEVTLAYMEKGLNWSPSYLINIKSDKLAEITLEAVLLNDVEDIVDAEVSFVVGYPNFMYSDIYAPLMVQQSVAQFVKALVDGQSAISSSGGYGGAMSQSVNYFSTRNRAAYSGDSISWSPETAYNTGQAMPGESNEDLYFYRQQKVTLKKGDRARYTVFTNSVPYEHVYLWEIPDSSMLDDRGYVQSSNSDNKPTSDNSEQVWHSIRLDNTTKQPWTTAPAFTVNGSMPMAQDVLKYAPPKGKTNLRLTLATDVRAEQSQIEVERNTTKVGYENFDEVTVNGKLKVKNMKSSDIKLNVHKYLVGTASECSEGGKITKVAKKVTAVNPQSEIEWEFPLPAGAEKEMTYNYKILVRR